MPHKNPDEARAAGREQGMKWPRVHYGNRYQVKLWIPPERILEVAHSRTEGMTGYFLETGSSDYSRWRRDLYRLTAAAYLQGINDAVEAEIRSADRSTR